jgi:hypothetical protein
MDQLLDILRHERLRADAHIDRQAIGAEQPRVTHILAGANAGDLRRSAKQRVRDLARDHVDLVAVRQRDHHVGILCACPLEHVGIRCIADDGAYVEPILQLAQHLRVAIDDRDLVRLLAGKAVGDRRADLPSAKYQDIHKFFFYISSRLAYATTSHFVPPRSKLTCTRA